MNVWLLGDNKKNEMGIVCYASQLESKNVKKALRDES